MKNVDKILAELSGKRSLAALFDEGVFQSPVDIVGMIERISVDIEGITGREKHEGAVEWFMRNIKLRFIPRWLKKTIFGQIVAQTVEFLNDRYGHEWGHC